MLTMIDKENVMNDTTGLTPIDAAVFRVIAVLNVLFAGLSLWLGGAAAYSALTAGTISVPLQFAEPVRADVQGTSVITAESDSAAVTADSISAGARAWLAAGDILGGIVGAVVAIALALLLWRLAQGRPFHRSLFGAALLAGATMTLGGLLGIFASGFGAMQVAFEVDPDGEVFTPGFEFDPAILSAGMVALVLAFVFRAGTRLQRDTEGLV
jgi:hypothetical protein